MLLRSKVFALILLVAILAVTIEARNYAVLVAGSNYWFNYRHQADVAHHYHILRQHGFEADDIITFMMDDLAQNQINAYPGAIFNKPSPDKPGINYYDGVKIDYAGEAVNVENFRQVMLGNSTKSNSHTGGRVLQSGPKDNVYLYFSGHGTLGALGFPEDEMSVLEFRQIIERMGIHHKFHKLLIYIEACESGSMCNGWIPSDSNVYCMTASNDDLPSWAVYCKPDDIINGERLLSCLGDEFSTSFMEYIDNNGLDYTIEHHFQYTREATERSPVMRYGDLSIADLPLSYFLRQVGFNSTLSHQHNPSTGRRFQKQQLSTQQHQQQQQQTQSPSLPYAKIESRNIKLAFLFDRYIDEDRLLSTHERYMAGVELADELQRRLDADVMFSEIAQDVVGARLGGSLIDFTSDIPAIACGSCCDVIFDAIKQTKCEFTDYSFKYARAIHNMCTMNPGPNTTARILEAVHRTCLPSI